MNLNELAQHFSHLYGRRNRIFLPSLRQRIDFLNLAVGDFQDAVRKNASCASQEIALARLVARIFCIAEHFHNLPLATYVARKYPAGRCSYCQQFPCACTETRPPAVLAEAISPNQSHWSIRQWCRHFDLLYGARNKEKGIENLINRLFREVCELQSLAMNPCNGGGTLDEIEEAYALELADALAWTMAIANVLSVDLERAVWDRFGNGCWNCEQPSCVCTVFNTEPVQWPRD